MWFSMLLILVLGALIGKQKGRNIEVMNSFELVFDVVEGSIVIDNDYYNVKEEQCKLYLKLNNSVFQHFYLKSVGKKPIKTNTNLSVKQVFSEMDFLGWYTSGTAPNPSDIDVHKQVHSTCSVSNQYIGKEK